VDVKLQFAGVEASISIPGNNQRAIFIEELPEFSNVSTFRGGLRITATSPIVVAGLRVRANQRGEILIANTTASNETALGSFTEAICPYFADGMGYSTQVVLFGGTTSGTVYFFDQSGNPAFLLFE
jgi:hypothetical protein